MMNIDIGRSVTYPFEDRSWSRKLIVLLILSFIPGLNLLVWGGYALSVARNINRREPHPLPTWDNWSDISVRGLLSSVATGLYLLPIFLGGIVLSFFWFILGGRAESMFNALQCGAFLFTMVYVLATNLILNAGHVRYAQTDQFHVYFDLRARLRDVRTHSSLFLMLLIYQTVLSFIAVGLVIIGIGVITIGTSLVVTSGAGLALIIIPIVLAALVGFLSVTMLAFLANGYFLGTTSLILTRWQQNVPQSAQPRRQPVRR